MASARSRHSIVVAAASLAVAISVGLASASSVGATPLSPANTINWPSPRPFVDPQAIAVGPTGERVYVADTGRNRIEEFSADGVVLRAWGKRGTKKRFFIRPTGVATDREGHVYVADSGNSRIQVFDEDGKFIRAFPVAFAYKVATAPGGRVYVLTSLFQLVAIRSSTGDDLGAWRATFPGKFWFYQGYDDPTNDAVSIAPDAQGNALVAGISSQPLSDPPPDCHAIQQRRDWEDPLNSGEVARFNGAGAGLGYGWLNTYYRDCYHGAHGYGLPRGLAVDPNGGDVYVADGEHHIDVLPGSLDRLREIAMPCPQCDPDPAKYFSTDPKGVAFDCRSNLYVLTPDRVIKYRSPPGTSSSTCVSRLSLEGLLLSDTATVKNKGIWLTVDCTRATCGGVIQVAVRSAKCGRNCPVGRAHTRFHIRRGASHRVFVPAHGLLQQLIRRHIPLDLTARARLGKRRVIKQPGIALRQPSSLRIDCPSGGTVGKPVSLSGALTPARSGAVEVAATTAGVSGIHGHPRTDARGRWRAGFTPTRAGRWAIDADAAGNAVYASAHAGCQVAVAPAPSSLSLVCPSSGTVGTAVGVSGRLTPVEAGQPILITYITPSGRYLSRSGTTGADGRYRVNLAPDEGGRWTAIASWNGDAAHARAHSKGCHFAVAKLSATLTLDCPSGSVVIVGSGTDYTFTGRLTPAAAASAVRLTYQRPYSGQLVDTVKTNANGYYSDKVQINEFGSWTVDAHFAGDARRKPADAATCTFFAHYP